jgi:sugar phosphate isomerase/epimerase
VHCNGSPPSLERLVELTGATNVGAEMGLSHLMWQGMDVVGWLRTGSGSPSPVAVGRPHAVEVSTAGVNYADTHRRLS